MFKGRLIRFAAFTVEGGAFGTITLILWNVNAIQGIWPVTFLLFTSLTGVIVVSDVILNKYIENNFHTISYF